MILNIFHSLRLHHTEISLRVTTRSITKLLVPTMRLPSCMLSHFSKKRHLYVRSSTFPLLGIRSRQLTLVDPWRIIRSLILKPLLDLWLVLNLISSHRRIPIFVSYLLQIPINFLMVFLLNLFGMNLKMRDVHAWDQHSRTTLINHKIGYPHTKFVRHSRRICNHCTSML